MRLREIDVLNLVLVKDGIAIFFERKERSNVEFSRNEHFYMYISYLHTIKKRKKVNNI